MSHNAIVFKKGEKVNDLIRDLCSIFPGRFYVRFGNEETVFAVTFDPESENTAYNKVNKVLSRAGVTAELILANLGESYEIHSAFFEDGSPKLFAVQSTNPTFKNILGTFSKMIAQDQYGIKGEDTLVLIRCISAEDDNAHKYVFETETLRTAIKNKKLEENDNS